MSKNRMVSGAKVLGRACAFSRFHDAKMGGFRHIPWSHAADFAPESVKALFAGVQRSDESFPCSGAKFVPRPVS